MLQARVFKAIQFATSAHDGQYRKGTQVPYIVHPFGVAMTLLDFNVAEDVIIAALLHDAVEDTDATLAQIRSEFGENVARIVDEASEPNKADSWENRKQHTIESLQKVSPETLLVSVADKLDNLRSIRRDLEQNGEAIWDRFKRPREQQQWYYQSLCQVFLKRGTQAPLSILAQELARETALVFPTNRA